MIHKKIAVIGAFAILIPALSSASWQRADGNLRRVFDRQNAVAGQGGPEIPTGPTAPRSQASGDGAAVSPVPTAPAPTAPTKESMRLTPRGRPWWEDWKGTPRTMGLALGILAGMASGAAVGLAVAASNPAGWAVLAGLAAYVGVVLVGGVFLNQLIYWIANLK